MSNLFEERFAGFSDDRKYRFWLSITWNKELPRCSFIGLNPSIADEFKDDNTIRRCKRFAHDWGFGSIVMLNVFAWISTDRAVLSKVDNPVGENNTIGAMQDFIWPCEKVIAAWGKDANRVDPQRVKEIISGFKLYCLRKNIDGSPEHPLYLPKILKPVPFNF